MGVNSTSTAYSMGQMGSIYVGGTTKATSNEVTTDTPASGIVGVGANAVFVAITFVTDTVFNSDAEGLVAETKESYPDSTGAGKSIDADAGAVVDSVTFPAGLTIYGRWTGFKLASGSVIAYVGY